MARPSGARGGGGRPPGKKGRPRHRSGASARPGGKRLVGKPHKGRAAARQAAGPQPHEGPGGNGRPERLQKILAHAGLGSRRECEEYILQGRVTVDGQVVRELGTRVDPKNSSIAVDGEKIKLERMVYYAVNKPKGYVSTNDDPAGRPRVVDLLPEIPERVYSVGRLDEGSTGLMILTNDGELANRLAHPRYGVEKTYRALVAGSPSPEVIRKLSEGVWLSDGKVQAKRARVVGSQGEATLLELVLSEGKKREIRRMLAKLGHKVMSLTRIAIGPVVLKGLPLGEHRPLSRAEIDLLQKVAAGIEVSPPRFLGPKSRTGQGGKRPSAARSRRAEEAPAGPGERPPRSGGRRRHEREPEPQEAPTRSRAPRGQSAGKRDRKPLPGRPAAAQAASRKPAAPGKPMPGKPPAGKPQPGAPHSRPQPVVQAVPGDHAESRPRRKIIGLTPQIAAEAGLVLPGKTTRKRPAGKRRPPRRVFGIRRPDGDGGGNES